jgi:6-phosphogluconolactonase
VEAFGLVSHERVINPEFSVAAAERIAAALREAVAERGSASLALAGGNTPRPVYEKLATLDVPWERVHVYFGDERCVEPDDAQSNYRAAREALLDQVPVGRVLRMEAEREDREWAADDYAALLPEALDVLLLGMGADGHTASLFPGHAALEERERKVVPVEGPKPPPWRLTITAPVIAAARQVFVLVTGAGKAQTVAQVLGAAEPVAEFPIRLARHGVWFLDPAAAGALT